MEAEFIKRGSSDAESEVRVCNTCTCMYINTFIISLCNMNACFLVLQ